MKQYITKKQWDELNIEEKKSFKKKVEITSILNKNGNFSSEFMYLPSIGQMIEFLGENNLKNVSDEDCFIDGQFENVIKKEYNNFSIGWGGEEELCDQLWKTVKKEIKNNKKLVCKKCGKTIDYIKEKDGTLLYPKGWDMIIGLTKGSMSLCPECKKLLQTILHNNFINSY